MNEELKRIISEHGLSNSDVARISGKSPATVSQVINGKYNGRPEAEQEILETLRQYASAKQAHQSTSTTVWLTEGERLIEAVLNLTYAQKGFSTVVGPSGIGKTFMAKNFTAKHEDACYMRCADGMSMGDVIQSILEMSGITSASGTKTQRMKRAIRGLREKGVRMIVVDEADLLVTDGTKSAVLRKISVFREVKEAGIAVAMIGLESFDDALRLSGETYVTSRIDYFRRIIGMSRDDLERFTVESGFDPEDDETKLAITAAPKSGFMRFLQKLYDAAQNMGSIKNAMALVYTGRTHTREA